MTEEKEKVQRVVRGGATKFPRENPRPQPLPFSVVFKEFVICTIRGPLIAAVLTKAAYPSYARWLKTYLANGGSESGAFTLAMGGIHNAIYLASFAFFEVGGKSEWLHQYQLPRTPAQEPTFKMKARTIFEFFVSAVLNHFILLPSVFKLFKKFGMPDGTVELPSLLKIFGQFVFASVFNRFGFAFAHRLFHHGPFYRAFHKKHHEYVGYV